MTTTAAPAKRWTVDDLLELPDWERYEIVDGELRDEGKDMDAAETTSYVSGVIFAHIRGGHTGRLLSEQQQYQIFHEVHRVRKADVSFFRASRAPEGDIGICEVAPDLVVEVVSKSNAFLDVWAKVEAWLAAGVEVVWLVVPVARNVIVFQRGERPVTLSATDTIDGGAVLPGFEALVGDLFPPPIPTPGAPDRQGL